MIRFAYPWFLILLSAVPLIGLMWRWLKLRSTGNLSRLIAPEMQSRLLPQGAAWQFPTQLFLILLALSLLVIALARPQWGTRTEIVHSRSRNVVIALDVSRSMLATDVHPSRLERAKVDIMDLINDLSGDRAALLAFRRRGVLLCPLTTDYTFLRQALDGVAPEAAPPGETDLADGIYKSLEALEPAFDQHNAILLISDGEDLAESAIAAARDAAKRGVPIFTVGIGSTEGAKIPLDDGKGFLQGKGADVVTRLKEETLIAVARESGGQYIPLATAGTAHTTLGAIYRRHLRRVSAIEQQERIENRYSEQYYWFLLPAILLLLIAAFLSRGRLSAKRQKPVSGVTGKTLTPPPIPTTLTIAILMLSYGAVRGQPNIEATKHGLTSNLTSTVENATPNGTAETKLLPGRAGARVAQKLYRQGNYAAAAEQFIAAARGVDIEDAQRYRFNAALALNKAGRYDEAFAILQPLTVSADTGARASDLMALVAWQLADKAASTNNAIERLKYLEQSAGGVQQSLRNKPDDARRLKNVARILPLLPPAREEAHIAEVLEKHGNATPGSLLEQMFRTQRDLYEKGPEIFTNAAPLLIAKAEALGKRQAETGDFWIPLKKMILEAPQFTNTEQRAEFQTLVENSRDKLAESASRFQDLDINAVKLAAESEPLPYSLWKQIAMPPALLNEDIELQSNTIVRSASPLFFLREDQKEAHELTTIFKQQFPPWADQVMQQMASDTNAPSFTKEDREEIERLTEETEKLQTEISSLIEPVRKTELQQKALENLLRIRELLPKQSSSQQQPDQQQQQEQQSENNQEQQNNDNDESTEKQQDQPQDKKPEEVPKDAQEILRRALQREKEHEEEKRKQIRNLPMSPDERDY